MGDGRHGDDPKISPPPRIPAPPAKASGDGATEGRDAAGRKRQIGRAALVAAMAIGLLLVFVFLPRWQDKREQRLAAVDAAKETFATPEYRPTATPEPAPPTAAVIENPRIQPTVSRDPVEIPPPPENTRRPRQSEDEKQYIKAMSDSLAALDRRQWETALSALDRASKLKPGAPEVADGIARANAGQRREKIEEGIRTAQALEAREAWREAERTYTAVLTIDPESAQALDGQSRAEDRAALDEKIGYHLANPGRLATDKVFSDASAALDEALETVPSGPRLEAQIARLERLLEHVSTPVEVVLESDEMTEVLVYRVGRLGTFSRRQLTLKPGAYTVVGSRSGFRDVRFQLVVTPGSKPEPLVVRCTEGL
jgi:tetratricopeptide (TPR) repeat protein